jgi:VWFA-related protein
MDGKDGASMKANQSFLKCSTMWGLCAVMVLLMAMFLPPVHPQLRAADDKQTMKVDVQEVVIDLVARDKKGKALGDLKASDVEVSEDGARQTIKSFRLVDQNSPAALTSSDPLQKVKLVTMVFQNQQASPDGQSVARKFFNEFLNTNLGDNVVIGLFTLDKRFCIAQQYTNKKESLQAALDRAISQDYEALQKNSDSTRNGLLAVAGGLPPANPDQYLGGTGNPQLDKRLAQLTTKIMKEADAQPNDQGGWRTVVFSLQSVVKELGVAPGRKPLFYYAWGLWVDQKDIDHVNRLISMANRSRISIYPVYLAALSSWSQTQGTRDALQGAAEASKNQAEHSSGAVSGWQMRAGESAEGSIRTNALEALTNLGKATSGMLIGESNDFKTPAQQASEDINSYYEITYTPENSQYDGKFRKISVKVPKAKIVMARTGYFAVPPTAEGGPALLAYEVPLLGVLNQPAPAHTFDYRIRLPHFDFKNGLSRHMLLMEVPMENFTFAEDPKTKKFQSQFALMVLFKDGEGKIVEKVSQFYPFEITADRLEAFKKSNVLLSREVQLTPGTYSVEAVAFDKPTEKSSVMKSSLTVTAPAAGLQMSSLNLIKKVEPVNPNDTDTTNPFRWGNKKISIYADDPVTLKIGTPLQMYFVAYPAQDYLEKPKMTLQILQDGVSLGELPAELPAADPQGRIQYTGTLPTNAFAPGKYELKVLLTQGVNTVEGKSGLNLIQ